MDTKTLQLLDYYRIRDQVAGFCASEEGQAQLMEREPLTDAVAIEALKSEAREWTTYLKSSAVSALTGWPPVRLVLKGLTTEGASITPDDAHSLLIFCRAAETLKRGLISAVRELPVPVLGGFAARLPPLQAAASLIAAVIDDEGNVRNLPELRAIRNSIRKINADIASSIKKYTAEYSDVLQSPLPALRSGRQTLAVKSQHKNKIRGILHEVSQTGQTVYIEPEDIVRKNNDLAEEEFRLEREIRRILRELAEKLRDFHGDFMNAWDILTHLDCSLAAARWGMGASVRASFAEQTTDLDGRGIHAAPALFQARHPILGDKAVPVDIQFVEGRRIIVISGPNTGGKTVALKTFALLALLNQSGFPIPVTSTSRLPVFSSVFADIGDDQSIDNSLSNFSAHLKTIARIVREADDKSLVLLDELGSGTDPEEGSALAFAILDALIEKRAFVLVTTHHGALKNYAYSHAECENASAEFDPATLSPTYRILTGVPGESCAIEIARKSDLDPRIVERAASYLAGEQTDISALIRGLTERYEEADRLTQGLRQKEAVLDAKARKFEDKARRLQEKEAALTDTERREARRFLDESRKRLENLVRELREGEITREKTRAVKQFLSEVEEGVNTGDTEVHTKQYGALFCPQKDTTVRMPDALPSAPLWTFESDASDTPVLELRLLGMRQNEALKTLERQLDLAAIRGLQHFAVIHGKGNGVLQQAVATYLAKYPGVREFYFARPEDGGTGKTYVEMGASMHGD
jgi:DNA mismatch repair protein MutS2